VARCPLPTRCPNIWITGYRGQEGDIIYIQAEDDFKVASVWVFIYDNQDKIIEKGEATFKKMMYGTTSGLQISRAQKLRECL
jgi:hypothetical protein